MSWNPQRLYTAGLVLVAVSMLTSCKEAEHVTYAAKPTPPAQAAAAPLLALTPTEYNQTLRDLLGLDRSNTAWWWTFPEESGVGGFEGIADGQTPSAYSIEQLQSAAVHFSSYTRSAPGVMACDEWDALSTAEQSRCGWESLVALAPRAWRRPLSAAETTRLSDFYEDRLTQTQPSQALEQGVAFLLQSPQFIYRLTPSLYDQPTDTTVALDDYEVASRLSYLLWDSMPDATLLAEAEAGRLSTAEQVRGQARRMLSSWRAQEAVVHFHRQWLGMRDIHSVSPARYAYGPVFGLDPSPPLDATGDFEWPGQVILLRHSMRLEFDLFVAQTLFDGPGSFEALMTDNRGYMSAHTQPLYGSGAVQISGESVSWSNSSTPSALTTDEDFSLELVPARFPENQRAGVLTQPGVLAIRAHAVNPAPILRGVFVLRDLACEVIGAPPDQVAQSPEVVDARSTNRLRTEASTSGAQCAQCHNQINPLGFAFENYDALGGWRITDNGAPVDATGSVTLSGGEQISFASGVDLAHSLAQSSQVKDCYVLKWAQVASGAQLEGTEPAVAALQTSFEQSDSVIDLLVALAASDLIRFGLGRAAP